MATRVGRWEAEDGTPFPTKLEAQLHDAKVQLSNLVNDGLTQEIPLAETIAANAKPWLDAIRPFGPKIRRASTKGNGRVKGKKAQAEAAPAV